MFRPVVANPDLLIREYPEQPRVAVACRWRDARAFGKRWPGVSVVGPLRTLRGLDGLVRDLLANPQIRVLVVDGRDLTPGEETTAALFDLWGTGGGVGRRYLGADLTDELLAVVRAGVVVVRADLLAEGVEVGSGISEDRPGGAVVLPPPAPTATATAAPGDPGQRVVGETFSDVWPQALREVMRFGRLAPSKYGETRELLGLVSVVRNPRASVEEVGGAGRTPFDVTRAQLEEYTRRVSEDHAPDEDQYSYGSRMAGQFAGVYERMARDPGDRGLFLTPWVPADQSKPGGRPCLVGVQFRVLDGALHLFACFRSHDLFEGYTHNLLALCAWLVRVAGERGLSVGALEVVSVSAHLYAHSWAEAQRVGANWPGPLVRWDQRSTWRVEVVDLAAEGYTGPTLDLIDLRRIRATALTPDGRDVVEVFEGVSASALAVRIERSGLVTSTGGAIWLGGELARAEARLSDPSGQDAEPGAR